MANETGRKMSGHLANMQREFMSDSNVESSIDQRYVRQIHGVNQMISQPESPTNRSARHKTKRLIWILVIMLITLYSWKTWERNKDWKSEELLFESAYKVCPNSVKVLQNYGILYRRRQEWSLAQAVFKKAKEIAPNFCDVDYWIALTKINEGKLIDGSKYLSIASACKYNMFPSAQAAISLGQTILHLPPSIDTATMLRYIGLSVSNVGMHKQGISLLVESASWFGFLKDRKNMKYALADASKLHHAPADYWCDAMLTYGQLQLSFGEIAAALKIFLQLILDAPRDHKRLGDDYSIQLPQLIPPGSSSLMDVHKKEMKKITTNQKSSLTSSKLAQYAQEPILQNIQDSDYCTQTRLLALDSIAGIVTPIYYKHPEDILLKQLIDFLVLSARTIKDKQIPPLSFSLQGIEFTLLNTIEAQTNRTEIKKNLANAEIIPVGGVSQGKFKLRTQPLPIQDWNNVDPSYLTRATNQSTKKQELSPTRQDISQKVNSKNLSKKKRKKSSQ